MSVIHNVFAQGGLTKSGAASRKRKAQDALDDEALAAAAAVPRAPPSSPVRASKRQKTAPPPASDDDGESDDETKEDDVRQKSGLSSGIKCARCSYEICKDEIDSGTSKIVFCGRERMGDSAVAVQPPRVCADCAMDADRMSVNSPTFSPKVATCDVCDKLCLNDKVAAAHCSVKCVDCRSVINRKYTKAIRSRPPKCPGCAKWPVCKTCDEVYSPEQKGCESFCKVTEYFQCYTEVLLPPIAEVRCLVMHALLFCSDIETLLFRIKASDERGSKEAKAVAAESAEDELIPTYCDHECADRKSLVEHNLKAHQRVPCSRKDCPVFVDPKDKSASDENGVCTSSCLSKIECLEADCDESIVAMHHDEHMVAKHGFKSCDRPVDDEGHKCRELVTPAEVTEYFAAKTSKAAKSSPAGSPLPMLLCGWCRHNVCCSVCPDVFASAAAKIAHLKQKHGHVRCNGSGCSALVDPNKQVEAEAAGRGWNLCEMCS